MLKTKPVVFVLHDTYHIMVPVTKNCTMWVEIGEERYYDESNGVLKSGSLIHRMVVPKNVLDRAGFYTVVAEEIPERKAYYTEPGEIKRFDYTFRPVKSGSVRCYHIADAHNLEEHPITAAAIYGDIDFLILNGDIVESSDRIENFDSIYRIAAAITQGEIPVVFARGNHDMRGAYAEDFAYYTPNEKGLTYYTFRIGDIWGMVLDTGEDKADDSIEYGHTICCHDFRVRQTSFIEKVIANAEEEYEGVGVRRRVVVVHNPFTYLFDSNEEEREKFQIEKELYAHWARLLRENIKPDVMICGHKHITKILMPGDKTDHLGHPCPIVVGSKPKENCFVGAGFSFEENKIRVTFTDSDGQLLDETSIG